MRRDIPRNSFFNEFSNDLQLKYFNNKAHAYLPNVDTFYYSAFIKNDKENNDNEDMLYFISQLEFYRQKVIDDNVNVYLYEDIQLQITRKKFSIYDFCLSVPNMFDIFISSYLPNKNTPRVVIQLRSIGLWTLTCEKLIYDSFEALQRLLKDFKLEVERTQENRIDFCYHTNVIHNMYKYFNDDMLINNCKTVYSIYSKVGRKLQDRLTIDYLSFGQRKSNNVFVRIYNKTREVIEMNYKSFFIKYWYDAGLISFYDKFVYEYAFSKGNYNALQWGKLEFYLQYGSDQKVKDDIELIKQSYSSNMAYVKKYIKGFLPDITLIVNIEFQTMRKFYRSGDKQINTFTHTSKVVQLDRLFKILDNRKVFLEYLTSNSLAFVKDDYKNLEGENIYLDWWARLRKLKLSCLTDKDYIREYSKNLEIKKLQSRLKGNIATLSLYLDSENDTSLNDDFSNVICSLNDNDFEKQDLQIIHVDTGEILPFSSSDYDYNRIKENKKKSLKSLLKKAKEPFKK